MTLIQKSPEVFLAEGPISAVGRTEIDTLKSAVKASPKGRARINAHSDGDDTLHEMIIAIDASSYIRPHKHLGKSEAFHIVEGEVDIIVFRDDGEIDRIVELGPPSGDRSRTISSNGSQGWVEEPAMLRKNEASGRITRRSASATCIIQAR